MITSYQDRDTETPTWENATQLASQLSLIGKIQLVEWLGAKIKQELVATQTPKLSLYGLCADLGIAPSAEEIDKIRQEVWVDFPRNDIIEP